MQRVIQTVILAILIGRVFTAPSVLPTDTTKRCPPGWIAGTNEGTQAIYCYNCGLPGLGFVGCPACDGICSSRASELCRPFSGHDSAPVAGSCKGQAGDPSIFPHATGIYANPVECHSGSNRTINAQAFLSNDPGHGSHMNDMCQYLLGNCPNGIRDQAVIYEMGRDGLYFDNSADALTDDDFTAFSSYALKLTSLGKSCLSKL